MLRFCATAGRSFNAALKLAALCSGRTQIELQSAYNFAVSSSSLDAELQPDDVEEEAEDPAKGQMGQDAASLLQRLRDSNSFAEKMETGEVNESTKPQPGSHEVLAEESARGKEVNPDVAEATKEACDAGEMTGDFDLEKFKPRDGRDTLAGALKGHEAFEASKEDLFRLLAFLRVGPMGCDGQVIKNHLLTRAKVQKKGPKWQNMVQRQIACAEAIARMPAMRQSRQQAWINHTEEFRQKQAPWLPSCISIDMGQVVAVLLDGRYQVASLTLIAVEYQVLPIYFHHCFVLQDG